LLCFSILAGPPFRTDDPDPVEYHHWEFYCASQIVKEDNGVSGIAPYGEVNYGIAKWMHIHLNVPMNFVQPRGQIAEYGPGDVEFGCKCRLVDETPQVPRIGIFPVVEIPTGNAEKELGAGNFQVFIPVWFEKNRGPWTTYCGGGDLITFSSNPVNSFFMGWEGQRDFSKFITVGAEIFTIIPSKI